MSIDHTQTPLNNQRPLLKLAIILHTKLEIYDYINISKPTIKQKWGAKKTERKEYHREAQLCSYRPEIEIAAIIDEQK